MSVQEVDMQAVNDALEALNNLGYDVEKIDGVEYGGDGLTFDLTVRATTRHGSAVLIEEDEEGTAENEVDADIFDPQTEAEEEFRERMNAAAADPDVDEDEVYADEVGAPETEVPADGEDEREEIGVYTAASYGISLTGVQEEFESERVTVRSRDYGALLVPGAADDDAPDYKVGDDCIQLGNPGLEAIGVDDGDDVRAVPDPDGVRLELVGQERPEPGAEVDQIEALVEADDAPDSWPECQACGRPVNPEWARVNAADEDEPEYCSRTDCPNLRARNGEVRKKRSGPTVVSEDA